jgi:hypothetical protein
MLGDDLIACLMGDIYTDVEKTMIELQRKAVVAETRSAFQHAMEHRFIATVEQLTHRKVAQSSRPPMSALTSSSSCSCSRLDAVCDTEAAHSGSLLLLPHSRRP